MPFHFSLSATNSLHLLTPSTWRSLSNSSFHLFLGLHLPVPSSSWVKTFLVIISSSFLSRWPIQLILWPFIHFTIFSPLFVSSCSRFVRLFHSPFSYLWPYILLITINMRNICNSCVIWVGVFVECLWTQYYVLISRSVNWHTALCSV